MPDRVKLTERQKEDRLDRRQSRCAHSWKHVDATVHNRLVTSCWCRKCMLTAREFERRYSGRALLASNAKTGE
jgi:hypothetical protein